MLTLPIKKKWFDMILSGEKKEEYRELNGYYYSRFTERKMIVKFRNGYRADSPSVDAFVLISVGYGKPEWGAEPGKKYYVLKILGFYNYSLRKEQDHECSD